MSPNRDGEAAVLAVEAAYDRAWQAGDLDALIACVAEDAVLVSPRGELARGRAEIRRLLGAFLSGPARGTTHTTRIERVGFVTEDVAIVDGSAEIASSDGSGSPQATIVHRFTDVLRRDDGRWAIAHVRAYVLLDHAHEDIP